MRPHRHALAATLLAGLIAGCATPGDEATSDAPEWMSDPRLGKQVDRICFASSIDSFTQATDRTVVLERGVNDYYLVETFGNCRDLDWAQSIGIDSATSCLTRGDALYASDSAFTLQRRGDIPPQRCPVKRIFEWNPDAESPESAEDSGDDAA